MHDVALRFWGLLQDTAPALLLAYGVTAIVSVLAPRQSLAWLARGGHYVQSLKGMLVALPLPLCSCSVLPPFRRFAVVGGAPAAAVAFLLAGPEIGLDSLFVSLPMLGGRFTLWRIGTAVLVALVAGVVIGLMVARKARTTTPSLHDLTARAGHRERGQWRAALLELPAHTGPYILIGLALSALLGPTPPIAWLVELPAPLQVLVLASAGIPTYVCASAATPLVATLIAAGISPGAGLAFLITGPATNVTTFAILAQVFGRRAAWVALLAVCAIAVVAGLLANLWGPTIVVPARATLIDPTTSLWRSIAAIAFLTLVSAPHLWRQGSRLLQLVAAAPRPFDTRP
jgi:uncharacterized membrane protein YraQ (UPF0718 family)